MLPEMEIPEVHTFEAVLERAGRKAAGLRPKAALIVPCEIDDLKAFVRAWHDRLIEPVFIGDKDRLIKTAAEHHIGLGEPRFEDVKQPDEAVTAAARMAKAGETDLIAMGQVPVARMLALLFASDQGFRLPARTVSHVAVLKPEKYRKLLLLTDSAVVVQPDLKKKVDLIKNLVFVSERIGIAGPRVAVVGAVEVIYPQMPATVEAAVLAKMGERGQIKGARVDGPLSFDVAVDMAAAYAKGIKDSPVAGQADALVAPNIEVANGVYNAMTLYGRCQIGGVIVGGRVPLAVNARADSEAARYNSIVLSVLAC
ncbi:MAG TPA: phosphate acyltransferase [Acidobacteriota bacterium]|nr:phosphate acyltransferase [Acidobacteriota bacterium]